MSHPKLLFVLVSSVAGAGSLFSSAAVAGDGQLHGVARDCVRHGALTRAYDAPRLRKALRNLPPDVAQYSVCPSAIKSQLAGIRGEPGGHTANAVIHDFLKHGYLRFSYPERVLSGALLAIPRDMAENTTARSAIRSQRVLRS